VKEYRVYGYASLGFVWKLPAETDKEACDKIKELLDARIPFLQVSTTSEDTLESNKIGNILIDDVEEINKAPFTDL